ncbi:dihydrolipoyl dehydrogenase [Bacterioplanes sanyensis]|uniref:Dihydrolipoyl dehydrogenase n=1 Tax=Bacterioplanes sanyensis TaxID=1249553 RepID=A0A222FJ64_9GAMM|nr:dihydrolipoyl dehydrogenase [Bacterioplanes sanyensis]ASP38636.1 dihydrolipoyl dehydrogenase [Bacterioplanes sanyensis]
MSTLHKDVAIIGTGTAGLAAYRAAKEHTDSVVLIEAGVYGTTCARVGCMPSKLLIAAADAAHEVRHSHAFGVMSEPPAIDGKAVMQRVKSERDRFVGFVLESVDSIDEQDRLRGYARFIDQHTLEVRHDNDDTSRISAQRIVIASGSRPSYPSFFNAAKDRLIVNDDVFEWDDLPASVAVFGPGVIGLELGQALSRLGVQVSVFGVGGALGPFSDPEVKAAASEAFADQFHYINTDAQVDSIERSEDGVEIVYDGDQRITVDYLIAATGRRPNVDKLGLEQLDLPLDEREVPIANPYTMQIGNSPIFIAGDASNQIPLLHEAADQGKIAGDNAGRSLADLNDVRSGLRRSAIGMVFSDPQLATVGLRYADVVKRYDQACFAIGEVSFKNQGRSRVMLKNQGMLRVYAEQGTGLFLGAEMAGPRAEHIAHLLAWAHQQKMTIPQMLDMPFYHPVVEEGLRTALRDVNANLHLGKALIDRCAECGVGS